MQANVQTNRVFAPYGCGESMVHFTAGFITVFIGAISGILLADSATDNAKKVLEEVVGATSFWNSIYNKTTPACKDMSLIDPALGLELGLPAAIIGIQLMVSLLTQLESLQLFLDKIRYGYDCVKMIGAALFFSALVALGEIFAFKNHVVGSFSQPLIDCALSTPRFVAPVESLLTAVDSTTNPLGIDLTGTFVAIALTSILPGAIIAGSPALLSRWRIHRAEREASRLVGAPTDEPMEDQPEGAVPLVDYSVLTSGSETESEPEPEADSTQSPRN